MRAVDTNVLVRLITRDDSRQAASAESFIGKGAWVSLLALAAERDLRIANLDVQGANLEDVFLAMTGHKLMDDDQHEGPEAPAACPACAHPQAYFEMLLENW